MQSGNLFSERLAELMKEKGVNTVTLGAAIGVSDETVRRWRNGQRSVLLPQMEKLADYFECSLDFLAGRTDVVSESPSRKMPPFYDRLRSVMSEKGVSRYRLVRDLPVYDSYFSNWKRGESPDLLTLMLLADYLGVTIDRLVGREE